MIDVKYSERPQWILPSKDYAETECRELNKWNVSIEKFDHHCLFTVEAIDSDQFAIECEKHLGKC